MSNRSRLLLLSGPGGAGTTSLVAATARALADEGLRSHVVDASVRDAPNPEVVAGIRSSIGRVLHELGADPLHVAAWSGLPCVAHLSTLREVLVALADPQVDAVIVDCGPLERARELIETPAVVVRLLDAALTPRMAMWRSPGEPDSESTVFEGFSDARHEVRRMQKSLSHPDTVARLVTTADASAVTRTLAAVSTMCLLGVGTDGVIVNRFTPEHDEQVSRLRKELDGLSMWTSTTALRPSPDERSALGPLSRRRVLSEDALTLTERGDDYVLEVPIMGAASARAMVGRLADDLVVTINGAHRWLALPAVLRRCIAVEARRGDHGLTVRFTPDPAVWRQPAGTAL